MLMIISNGTLADFSNRFTFNGESKGVRSKVPTKTSDGQDHIFPLPQLKVKVKMTKDSFASSILE